MTTRTIEGRQVVADEATPAPIKGTNGSPIYWRQIRTLLLDNGDTVYGCAHCDYTSPNPLSIRPHLSVHKDKRPNGNGDGDVQQLLDQLSRLKNLTEDRDHWKQRAQKAEKDLRAIRRAIGGES